MERTKCNEITESLEHRFDIGGIMQFENETKTHGNSWGAGVESKESSCRGHASMTKRDKSGTTISNEATHYSDDSEW